MEYADIRDKYKEILKNSHNMFEFKLKLSGFIHDLRHAYNDNIIEILHSTSLFD